MVILFSSIREVLKNRCCCRVFESEGERELDGERGRMKNRFEEITERKRKKEKKRATRVCIVPCL